MEGADNAFRDLRAAYVSAGGLSSSLNAPFREALKTYAKDQSFLFSVSLTMPLHAIAPSLSNNPSYSKTPLETSISLTLDRIPHLHL